MTKKKPFTWEQKRLIGIDVRKGIKKHVERSDAHNWLPWLLCFIVFTSFITLVVLLVIPYSSTIDNFINTKLELQKAEIYEELGYEKVCLGEICSVDEYNFECTKNCIKKFDYAETEACIWGCDNVHPPSSCDCTKWQWQPKMKEPEINFEFERNYDLSYYENTSYIFADSEKNVIIKIINDSWNFEINQLDSRLKVFEDV